MHRTSGRTGSTLANTDQNTYGLRHAPPSSNTYAEDGDSNTLDSINRAAIGTTSDFFLIADAAMRNGAGDVRNSVYYILPTTASVSAPAVHLRHNGAANALFADGHAWATQQSEWRNVDVSPQVPGTLERLYPATDRGTN